MYGAESLLTITDVQDSTLSKRVVTLIKRYPQPKEIFLSITSKELDYSIQYKPKLPIRDRAIMAAYYASAGRGAEVCGGHAFTRSIPTRLNSEGKKLCVVCGQLLAGGQRKFCRKECRLEIHTKTKPTILPDDHLGILIENIEINENRILIKEMPTVKRSQYIKEKYPQATIRPDYWIPLKTGLFENPFWDQLVPFGWLLKEYYDLYIKGKKTQGKLFNIQNRAAYQIVRQITGNYLNWFRAQGKQFYGSFIFNKNAVELAEFVNDKDSDSERPYTRYDPTRQLKDKSMVMDFDWILPAVKEIQVRIDSCR